MIPTTIPIPIPGGLATPTPRMLRARQRFDATEIADPAAAVAERFAALDLPDLTGKSVAVALGSRGIRSQPPVAKAVIDCLKGAGADVFIVPAMGSHGGGTAEGQMKVLSSYGLDEAGMGVPVRASMEVVPLGDLDDGLPVYCDRIAFEADHIVAVNRVKPHTSFRGRHESGMAKMLAIGLGKHTGAEAMHRRGMPVFGDLIPKVAGLFLSKTNVLFTVGIVENGYEKLAEVALVPPERILAADAAMLLRAKALIPRILLDHLDVLIVDQIGKDISGAGMDPNVTGRNSLRANDFDGPEIRQVIVRALTEATEGNATGVGMADITTQSLVRGMDWTKTYVNLVTAGVPAAAALPLVADCDRDALHIALRSCHGVDPATSRIVRIENTLDLGEIWASEAYVPEIEAHPDMEILSDPFDLPLDEAGALGSFHA